MKVLEKMESPGILRLGISAISSEKDPQNQFGFVGLFFKILWRYPTGPECL